MTSQSLSDKIRQFAVERYIKPAKQSGRKEVTIRSGDIHRLMELENQMPAVCGALGTKKFGRLCNVRQIRREGQTNNSNVLFTFEIL